jgi:phage shock protein PspC (stress-responsive transcriptional regulator)
MNDTQQSPPPGGHAPGAPDGEFDPHRLRTIADVQRSRDDRIVAGVCSGAARYLNVDPVIIRVVLAVLTFAGFAGVILYVAAWILLPAEGDEKSLAAEWFKLDRNEEQVRVAGLVGAVILAALSIVGDSSWAWWGGTPWWLLPFALVLYVLWIRPRRRRDARARSESVPQTVTPTASQSATTPDHTATTAAAVTQPKTAKAREQRSPALLGLTASLGAIALAATVIYEQTQQDVHWTAYVAVALAVVGVGLLIGTVVGDGGSLIAIGVLLAVALAIGSVFPAGPIGQQRPTPLRAAELDPTYRHGIGLLELDLTGVSDPEALLGRTVTLDAGIGQTKVVVPVGLNVAVRGEIDAGQIVIFDRQADGTDAELSVLPDQPALPALTIEIDQDLGNIEVIR